MFYKHLIPNAKYLTEGNSLHFQAKHADFVIVKQQGTLLAYENRCPHQKRSLSSDSERFFDDDGDYLKCRHHGALFTPSDGQCIVGPCQGKTLKRATIGLEEGDFYLLIAENIESNSAVA